MAIQIPLNYHRFVDFFWVKFTQLPLCATGPKSSGSKANSAISQPEPSALSKRWRHSERSWPRGTVWVAQRKGLRPT
jgi:hypothetical protein